MVAEGIAGSNMAGNLVLAGRVKDTIVLSNGENVEPQPIEDACSQSDYISFIVLYGQDRRALGALICKNQDAFDELEKAQGRLLCSLNSSQWLTSMVGTCSLLIPVEGTRLSSYSILAVGNRMAAKCR